MKSIVIAAAISLFLISCKKNSGSDKPQQTLVSEIWSSGLKELKFNYDGNNYLTKLESYDSDPLDNSLITYIVFQNNAEGQIKQFTSYSMPGNAPIGKSVITYDSSGKLVSATSYDLQSATPNTPFSTTTFTYNAMGKVNKIVEKDKGGKLIIQNNLAYYDDGHAKEKQSWKENGGALWMSGKISYSVPAGNYESGLGQLEVLLGSDFMARFYSDAIGQLTYSQAGVITKNTNLQMSQRAFNDDGTLKSQVITYKYVKPEGDDAIYQYEYKYVKQ